MIADYRPLVRRHAPYPPSRGVLRARPRSLPNLTRSRRYELDGGVLFVSHRIPEAHHASILTVLAEVLESDSGRLFSFDGEPFRETSLPHELGTIRLLTNSKREAYAYFDWEE